MNSNRNVRGNGIFTTRWVVILLLGLSALGLNKAAESSDLGSLHWSGFETEASTDTEPGMPERGRFLIIYAYQGQTIEPDITVNLNGKTIASLDQLAPVNWTTFVDLETEKGDQAVLDARFMDDGGTIALHNNFGSLTSGYWANQFNINFFLQDEDGNFVEHLGTMSIAFYLFPPFEGFALDADPGKIAPGEESRVSFESVELPDEPVIVPGNTSIDMRLSPNGKRLGGYAIPLLDAEGVEAIINFPYGFLANVPLYYRAYPDSTLLEGTSEEVQLGVFSHFNTSIAGQTEVEVSVEDDDYKIFISTELDSVYPQRTGGVESTQIEVNILKDDEPVAGFPLELKVKPLPNSGGHDHYDDKDRPTGTLDNPSGVTNDLGVYVTKFTSSEISGKEWIVASSPDISKKDSLKVTIKVPGLVELEESPLFVKVGAPDNNAETNDPCRPNAPTSDHFRNHWGTETLNNNLKNISKKFNSIYPEVRLRINDMSLQNGGIFDFRNNWSAPHKTHRTGKNADIGVTGIKIDGGCEWELNIDELEDIIYRVTQIDPLNEGSHLHIYTN